MKLSNAPLKVEAKIPITPSFPQLKQLVADIVKDLINNSDILNKKLSPEACTILSDAIAMGTMLSQNSDKLPEDTFKRSASRFNRVVTALFEENYEYFTLRQEVKEHQKALMKDLKPRSLEPDKYLVDQFPEGLTDNTTAKKTCSPFPPEQIAERIFKDLHNSYYYNAQEAYDGYCQKHGVWQFASARQKCILAGILRVSGFIIKNDEFEKEAEADHDAWLKLHAGLGKGERGPEQMSAIEPNKIEEDFKSEASVNKRTAGPTIEYCNNCRGSQKGVMGENGVFTCNKCGVKKNPQRLSMISMLVEAQTDPNQRPNILQNVLKKVQDKWSQFQTPISSFDITKMLSDEIDTNFQDPNEKDEEKQYLMNNPAVNEQVMQFMRDNNIPMSNQISASKTLKQAVSSEAEEYVSKKIKKLRDEGYEDSQASAIAYDYARKHGYEVPKKSVKNANKNSSFKESLLEKMSQLSSPADMDGIVANPQDTSDKKEMTKESMMRCSNADCGYMMPSGAMEKTTQMDPSMGGGTGGNPTPPTGQAAGSPGMQVDGQKCPKCGSMMEAQGAEKFPYVDNQSMNTSNEFGASDLQPLKKQMSDGSQYVAKYKWSTATESLSVGPV